MTCSYCKSQKASFVGYCRKTKAPKIHVCRSCLGKKNPNAHNAHLVFAVVGVDPFNHRPSVVPIEHSTNYATAKSLSLPFQGYVGRIHIPTF